MLAIFSNHKPRNEMLESLSGNIVGSWNAYNSTNTASGVLDQSGNGNNGTMTNMSDTDIEYEYPRIAFDLVNGNEGSFLFDGINEYVTIVDAADLSFTDDIIFISARINMSDATNFVIANKANEYLFLVNASDKIEARFIDNSTGGYIGRTYNTAITSNEDKWIFVDCTFDGTTVVIRIDGVQVDDTDANSGSFTSMEDTASALNLGHDGSNYADGYISHVSIGGLTTDLCQSQELDNDGSPVDPSLVTFTGNIVSHWCLDQRDNPTGTVNDIIGSNNGTATNSPTLATTVYPTN